MAAACSCPPLRLPAGLCSRGSPAESPAEGRGVFFDAAWGLLLSPPPVVLPSDCAAAAPPSLLCAHPAGMRPPSTSQHPPHIRGGSAGAGGGGFGQPPLLPRCCSGLGALFPKSGERVTSTQPHLLCHISHPFLSDRKKNKRKKSKKDLGKANQDCGRLPGGAASARSQCRSLLRVCKDVVRRGGSPKSLLHNAAKVSPSPRCYFSRVRISDVKSVAGFLYEL